MDIGELAENTSRGKTGGALVTIVLAGFLWVGKTTFEHVGQITALQHELNMSHQDQNLLRAQYDDIVGMLNERTKSRFTREDADKLVDRIGEVDGKHDDLKELFLRDYTKLKVEISEATHHDVATHHVPEPRTDTNAVVAAQHIHQLEGEIATLQAELIRLQRHLGMGRASEAPRALIAQPNLNHMPLTKR